MGNLELFQKQPTKQGNYFKEYNLSFFSLSASPEYSMGEVCLASLTRALGSRVNEKEVYSINSQKGSEIRNFLESRWREFSKKHDIKDNLFLFLKSPLAGQSPKNPLEYLNLYPITPQFSFVSNSARFGGNPWNPSEFIKGMIATGSPSKESAKSTWSKLFDALSVTESDDLWAQILNNIFSVNDLVDDKFYWKKKEFGDKLFDDYSFPREVYNSQSFPAKSFCEKIDTLLELKKNTTRRQWISIFESFLRLAMGTHLIWICQLNIKLWQIIWQNPYRDGDDLGSAVSGIFNEITTLELDSLSDPVLRRICGDYAEARMGINLVAHYFKEEHSCLVGDNFSNLPVLSKWLMEVKSLLNNETEQNKVKVMLLKMLSQNPKIQQGGASFSKNMFEFLKHSLGQKATADPKERNFDQGYWSVKKGYSRNSPWIVKLGPVSVITLVALAVHGKSGSAADLTSFLSSFGIIINPDKLLVSSLGDSLIDLGLTTDNPDGEKGVIILNPFQA